MTFLHPMLAAAGLACLAIPIIIHLLMRRRRRPVKWAAMRFLLEAYRQHRHRLRLEQIALLAARCAVIALAAMGLARPQMSEGTPGGSRRPTTLYLIVDDALPAAARDASGAPALERHKATALALLDELDPAAGDRAALITLGAPAWGRVLPASSSIPAVRDLVRALEPTHAAGDLPGALALVRQALADEPRPAPRRPDRPARARDDQRVVVVLSDFLRGSVDPAEPTDPSPTPLDAPVLIREPAATGPGNVTVVAVEPLRRMVLVPRPAEHGSASAHASVQLPVRVVLRRSGRAADLPATTNVRLSLCRGDQRDIPAGTFAVRWAPGQTEASATGLVEVSRARVEPTRPTALQVRIDADALAEDNTAWATLDVRQRLRIGLIAPRRLGHTPILTRYEPADWLRAALAPDPQTTGTEIELVEIDPSQVARADQDASGLGRNLPGGLEALDLVVLPRPETLTPEAWHRLRTLTENGGMILLTPPPADGAHLWPDAAAEALGLTWVAEREPRTYADGIGLMVPRPQAGQARDLLSLLDSELPDLAPPVRVWRVLPVHAPDPGHVLLRLTDGTPLILVSPPDRGRQTSGPAEEPAPRARGVLGGEANEPVDPAPPRGRIVLLTTAPHAEWTDLPARPLMVPLIQELARQGAGEARGVWETRAGRRPAVPPGCLLLAPQVDDGGSEGAMRVVAGRAADPVRRSGLWRATDAAGATRALLAVNPDPDGGRCDPNPAGEVHRWLTRLIGTPPRALETSTRSLSEESSAQVSAGHDRPAKLRDTLAQSRDDLSLALTLLAAALAIAVLELVLGRRFSHAFAGADAENSR